MNPREYFSPKYVGLSSTETEEGKEKIRFISIKTIICEEMFEVRIINH
jgi:hypothetical protein